MLWNSNFKFKILSKLDCTVTIWKASGKIYSAAPPRASQLLQGSLRTEDAKLNFSVFAPLEYWGLRPPSPVFSVTWSMLGWEPVWLECRTSGNSAKVWRTARTRRLWNLDLETIWERTLRTIQAKGQKWKEWQCGKCDPTRSPHSGTGWTKRLAKGAGWGGE